MAKNDSTITQQQVKENFDYVNGILVWKKTGTGIKKHSTGWVNDLGYHSIGFNRKTYRTHRLIFLYHYGYMPKVVDHIDGDTLNNRIENLREASDMQNAWNQKKRCTNTTGIKGVSFSKKNKKYKACCMINYKNHYLGYFELLEDAKNAVEKFRENVQGKFARNL